MKSAMYMLLTLAAVTIVVIGAWFLWAGFWPLDILRAQRADVCKLTTPQGETLTLAQEWAGDGYRTELIHQTKQDQWYKVVLDGDGPKAWHAKILPTQTNNIYWIDYVGRRVSYDLTRRVLVDHRGEVAASAQ